MGTHLVLIGLMGAGKTTVGRRCAELLGRPFVDTDDLVALLAGMTVAEVFATGGESRFRELERLAVAEACATPVPAVIACGGGAPVDARNREQLRESGWVVWLRASVPVLVSRVGDDPDRPLLAGGAGASLERLGALRAAAYDATAHHIVDTDRRGIDDVADAVIAAYEEHAA